MQRIGVFGASFNPPTLGHYNVIEQAKTMFDEILLVPSVAHPFQKSLAPIHHRLEMLNLFVASLSPLDLPCQVRVFNIEASMQEKNPALGFIYTYDVLTTIAQLYQSSQSPYQIRFILGPDLMQPQVWQKFYRYQEIEKNWPLFVAKEHIPIHSTMVREAMLTYQHDTVALKAVLVGLVGEKIATYILQHGLYQNVSD